MRIWPSGSGHEVRHLIVAGAADSLPAGAIAFDSLLAASEPLAEPAPTHGDDPGSANVSRASRGMQTSKKPD